MLEGLFFLLYSLECCSLRQVDPRKLARVDLWHSHDLGIL